MRYNASQRLTMLQIEMIIVCGHHGRRQELPRSWRHYQLSLRASSLMTLNKFCGSQSCIFPGTPSASSYYVTLLHNASRPLFSRCSLLLSFKLFLHSSRVAKISLLFVRPIDTIHEKYLLWKLSKLYSCKEFFKEVGICMGLNKREFFVLKTRNLEWQVELNELLQKFFLYIIQNCHRWTIISLYHVYLHFNFYRLLPYVNGIQIENYFIR